MAFDKKDYQELYGESEDDAIIKLIGKKPGRN